jgi:hypothetical protein
MGNETLVFPVPSSKQTILNVAVAIIADRLIQKWKVISEVFFDWQGIMHHEFILEGATVNKGRSYTEVPTYV